MKTRIEIELRPFTVPNFVIQVTPPGDRGQGIQEAPKYALSDLDPYTLERLCDEFRTEVFNKAGKQQPPQAACNCTTSNRDSGQ